MHPDEVHTDAALVRRLIAAQLPQWNDLPIERVRSAGTDNAIYRLGEAMAVRLPRRPSATPQVEKEHVWLPQLAPHLPLAIPVPLALGAPGEGYPWHWAVHRWLAGEPASSERIADPAQAAADLARFVAALQRIDPSDGPAAGPHNFFRGVPLAMRDPHTRAALAKLGDAIDVAAATAAWETALGVPAWDGPPVWLHGDLQAGNLLANRGRLGAVIDFGCLGVGDPACDVAAAWMFLSSDTRAVFRDGLAVDDATWARGRGWALSVSLVALPYYRDTNPVLVATSRRAIDEVLADRT